MKISYGDKIMLFGPDGTVYKQRVLLTQKEFHSINLAIESEIALDYSRYKEYANSKMDAEMYLKRLRLDGNINDICFLKLTQSRYISKFSETKGRLKMDRNTYIKVI